MKPPLQGMELDSTSTNESESLAEIPYEGDSRKPMNEILGFVKGLTKLLEYSASGIGSVAGSMLAPWQAKQHAKVLGIQAQSEADALLLMANAHREAKMIVDSPTTSIQGELDIKETVSLRLQFQEEKRQRNIQDVVGQAAEKLLDKTVPDEEPDHDWISSFFGNVQDVSTDEMKTLWSKVLTGQIEQPSSTSLLTLNVLKNLDVNTALLFRTLCSACITFSLDGKEILDVRVPVLNGNAAQNYLRKYGLSFDQLNVLNEYGLIISDYNSWNPNYQLSIGKKLSQSQILRIPFKFQGHYWVLEPTNERGIGTEFKVSGVSLTQAGKELSRIVDIQPVEEFARDLKKAFASHNLQMVQSSSHQHQLKIPD